MKLNPAAILYSRIDNPIAKFNEDKDDEEMREILKEAQNERLSNKRCSYYKRNG